MCQPDQWSNASPWAIDAAPGLWGLDTRATHPAALEAGLEGPASGGALLSERSLGVFAPRAVRLLLPDLVMSPMTFH